MSLETEKCPICLENPEDYGNCSMCYQCGGFVCETCSISLAKTDQRYCPICRERYANEIDEMIPYLEKLRKREIAREDGPRQNHIDYIDSILGIYMSSKHINLPLAREYLERTSLRGFLGSKYYLGYMYQHGLGGEKNAKKALKLYGESNIMYQSMHALSEMYENGEAVEKDVKYATVLRKITYNMRNGFAHCKTGKFFYV